MPKWKKYLLSICILFLSSLYCNADEFDVLMYQRKVGRGFDQVVLPAEPGKVIGFDGTGNLDVIEGGTGGGGGDPIAAGYGITIETVGGTNVVSLYIAPTITSFTVGQSVYEIGATATQDILSWDFIGTITDQYINQSTPLLDLDDRSVTNSIPHTSNRTYTLTITDNQTTNTANRTVYFRYKRFWGLSASSSLSTSQDIIDLGNSEFATSGVKGRTEFVADTEYLYYTYPEAWNEETMLLDTFLVHGWVVTTNSFTNAEGHTADYRVIRSENTLVGGHNFEAE